MTLYAMGHTSTHIHGLASLRSKRLSNIGREVLGNAGGTRSTRVKLALLAFPYSYTARPKLLKRLLRRLRFGRQKLTHAQRQITRGLEWQPRTAVSS